MHRTNSSLYLDVGDHVEVHGHDHELRLRTSDRLTRSDRSAYPERTPTFTIILPADPAARIAFLDELAEAAALMKREAYATLAADPRAQAVPAGEIAANE